MECKRQSRINDRKRILCCKLEEEITKRKNKLKSNTLELEQGRKGENKSDGERRNADEQRIHTHPESIINKQTKRWKRNIRK